MSQLELIQEDLAYATDEVERLSKVVNEQAALLEDSKALNIERENNVNTLKEQVLTLPFLLQSTKGIMYSYQVIVTKNVQ